MGWITLAPDLAAVDASGEALGAIPATSSDSIRAASCSPREVRPAVSSAASTEAPHETPRCSTPPAIRVAGDLARSAAGWSPIIRRISAAIIDYIVLGMILSGIIRIWNPSGRDPLSGHRSTVPVVVVFIAVRAAYDIIAIGRWGRTPGKAMFGIGVVDLQHQRAGWVRAPPRQRPCADRGLRASRPE